MLPSPSGSFVSPDLTSEVRPSEYEALVATVQACRLCPTMEGRRRALGCANGPLVADAIFVAEAPGRLGADRTGIPLSGDRAGANFGELLLHAGIERSRVFVTNAVLCNPRDDRGRNRAPGATERARCLNHLRRTLTIVRAPVIVSLGTHALTALGHIEPHGARLANHVGREIPWRGITLVPLYHPGSRARVYRTWPDQREDFRRLATTIQGNGVTFGRS
ncbi:MAG: uracil-DNA glycosylase [Chloroflexi bacterium]|nr:uracil-DNA glycosylase [Chloroflexota bacterium]